MLALASVSKRFDGQLVVDQVSFTVGRGEIMGVLGPNGAGKSTLLHMICGLIEPDGGEIEVSGLPFSRAGAPRGAAAAIRARMNIASPYAALPGQLSVMENLSVYAGLYGVAHPARRIRELLEALDIARHAKTLVSRLSSGQTIRVGLCKALLNSPDLLLLDEPTVFLDARSAAATRAIILDERARRGMAVVLTSHDAAEIERLCDRVVVMQRGRLIASGTPAEVTRQLLPDQTAPALDLVLHRVAS